MKSRVIRRLSVLAVALVCIATGPITSEATEPEATEPTKNPSAEQLLADINANGARTVLHRLDGETLDRIGDQIETGDPGSRPGSDCLRHR